MLEGSHPCTGASSAYRYTRGALGTWTSLRAAQGPEVHALYFESISPCPKCGQPSGACEGTCVWGRDAPYFFPWASAAGSAQTGWRSWGALVWPSLGVCFPDGRWIQSTLPLAPSQFVLASEQQLSYPLQRNFWSVLYSSYYCNKINSLGQKNPFCSWQYDRCDFSQRMQKWLPALFQNCLLQGCSFARLRGAEVVFSCVANYERSKIAWKNSPFPPF